MILRGEVKCYFCGFITGEVVGEKGAKLTVENFRASECCSLPPIRANGRLRCCRCGGPVFIEDISVVRDVAALRSEQPMAVPVAEEPLLERTAES